MIQKQGIASYLVSGSIWSVGGQLFSVVGSLLQMSMLSRLLTANELGSYLLIYSVVMFASIVCMFGFPETMMREVARLLGGEKRANSKSITVIRKTYVLVFFFTLVLSLILAGGGGEIILYDVFSIERSERLLLYTGIWLFLHCLHYTTIYLYRGLHDVVRATIYGVSIRSFFIVAVLALLYSSGVSVDLETALLVNVLAMLASLFLSVMPLRYLCGLKAVPGEPVHSVNGLVRQASPLCLNTMFQEVFLRCGMWVLGYFVVKEEVALYGAALQIVVVLVIPVRIFNGVLPPVISNYYFNKKNIRSLERIVRSTATVSTVLALGGVLFMALFGKQVLILVFGDYYGGAYEILLFLLIGQSTTVFFGPSRQILKMTRNQRALFNINFVFGLLTVLITTFCAYAFGALGVAVGASTVLVVANYKLLALTRKLTGIRSMSFVRLPEFAEILVSLNSFRKFRKTKV